jgi:hypothetical protein
MAARIKVEGTKKAGVHMFLWARRTESLVDLTDEDI